MTAKDNKELIGIRVSPQLKAELIRLAELNYRTLSQECTMRLIASLGRIGSDPPIDKLTVTIKQAAARLGISIDRAYAAAKSGQIPTVKIGRRRAVPLAALTRMIAESENDKS